MQALADEGRYVAQGDAHHISMALLACFAICQTCSSEIKRFGSLAISGAGTRLSLLLTRVISSGGDPNPDLVGLASAVPPPAELVEARLTRATPGAKGERMLMSSNADCTVMGLLRCRASELRRALLPGPCSAADKTGSGIGVQSPALQQTRNTIPAARQEFNTRHRKVDADMHQLCKHRTCMLRSVHCTMLARPSKQVPRRTKVRMPDKPSPKVLHAHLLHRELERALCLTERCGGRPAGRTLDQSDQDSPDTEPCVPVAARRSSHQSPHALPLSACAQPSGSVRSPAEGS